MDNLTDKVKALKTGEQLIAGGGIVMLIFSFFDWYHVSIGPFSGGNSGWGDPGAFWSIILILISIALAAIIIATKFGNMVMPALPQGVTWGMVWGGGAAIIVLFFLLKSWRILDAPAGGFGVGWYLGLFATIAIAAGGYLLYSEERAGTMRP